MIEDCSALPKEVAWVCGLTNFVVEKDLAMEDKKGQYHHMLQTNLTEEP